MVRRNPPGRAVFVLVLSLLLGPTALAQDEPFVDLGWQAALERAKAEDKIVMVDWFTTWCGPCKQLDRVTWKDPEVRAWLAEHVIAIKLDAEQHEELAQSQKVVAYPTILFAGVDGEEMDRLVGFRDPKQFLAEVDSVLAGETALDRARAKVAEKPVSVMERMSLGRELARRGDDEEALLHFLWCFDHGTDPSFTGVRLSFLLSEIDQLASRYPPARAALVERRDAAAAKLLADEPVAGVDAVMDLSSLNEHLGEPEKSIEVYDAMITRKRGDTSVIALRILLESVLPQLVEARRYDDVIKGVGDPLDFVEQKVKLFGMTAAFASEETLPLLEQTQVMGPATLLFEAVVGAARLEFADDIVAELLEFSPKARTFAALVRAAGRGGDRELARTIAARGLAEVPEDERIAISKALAELKDM